VKLPKGSRFLNVLDKSGRDSEVWACIEVPREQVQGMKVQVYRSARHRKCAIDVRLDVCGRIGRKQPDWWCPDQLPDPDVLFLGEPVMGGQLFIFSERLERVFMLIYDV
jgi:hypothetical protein